MEMENEQKNSIGREHNRDLTVLGEGLQAGEKIIALCCYCGYNGTFAKLGDFILKPDLLKNSESVCENSS